MRDQLVRRGLVSERDTGLYTFTQSCDEACRVIESFYANYHSLRYVGDTLVLRLQQAPTDSQLADLSIRFADLIASGSIHRTEPHRVEVRDGDHLDLERIAFRFTKSGYSDLVELIRSLNG